MAFDPIISSSDLTFSGEEIRTFAEATITQLVEYPAMNELHTIIPGIVAKKQIALLGHLSKITRKDLGCGLGKMQKIAPASQKFWDPVDFKIWLQWCWTQFVDTFMVYYLNVGGEKADLTTTEIFSQWLVQEVGDAAAKDAMRIAWFADTAAALTTAGGNFSPAIGASPAVDVLDYNMLNGFWKQLFAIATADPNRRVTIAENAAASYALQMFDDADIAANRATIILRTLVMKADRRLRANGDKVIWATRTLTDEYLLERLSVANIELAYTRVESGIDTLNILGVPVYVMDQWDDVIQSDQNNGTKYFLPHRAVMSTKDNLPVGFDAEAAVTDFKVFYDEMSETSNIKALYKMDAKVLEDYMVQVAY